MLALETPRLLLRELSLEDLPALHAVVGDAENMVWYPRAYTLDEVREAIFRHRSRYPSGTGLLGIVQRETGALIGDCGPVWQEVEGFQELEIGYHIHRSLHGQGFATEAARAVRDYAFATLGIGHVISLIRPGNLPSRRVAEKNGLILDRTIVWRDYEHCVYRLNRPSPR
jgi:[ribosomal protein S5]-alanine N-acetyltransferase